jgi:hypothetical protein
MDIQNEILDYLGDQATIKTLHEDFDGLNKTEILVKLNEWFPTEENETLAENIFEYISSHNAAVALGRRGGSVKSERKAKSSAANGKLGGRPKSKDKGAN